MTATDLTNTIRAIKARVQVPVTYADVWEFWLRNRDVANAVDFITIHILPYWEDFPDRRQRFCGACRIHFVVRSSPPFLARRS
jgi:exo-beta-1,3-glucanase (GH17 family)